MNFYSITAEYDRLLAFIADVIDITLAPIIGSLVNVQVIAQVEVTVINCLYVELHDKGNVANIGVHVEPLIAGHLTVCLFRRDTRQQILSDVDLMEALWAS